VEVKIPGGVESYAVNVRGERYFRQSTLLKSSFADRGNRALLMDEIELC
jgi:hypothetical protein